MERSLSEILEMQFNLVYRSSITIADYDNMDLRDIEWTYSRLLKQLKDEKEKK